MQELEQKLGYRFRDHSLLEQALTHPSYRNENNLDTDNQRLEFLGDAALGLSSAHHLFVTMPGEPEGILTKLRSAAASTGTLARLARAIDLGGHLLLGRGEENSGGREKENNLADALEAIVGAAFLDGGPEAVDRIFTHLFVPDLADARADVDADNPKGRLQEWAQARGMPVPEYRVVETSGPAHDRQFTVEVSIGGDLKATGRGSTKRSAEAAAAARLCEQAEPT